MAQTTVPSDMVADDLKTFSMTLRIADPTVDSHPFKLYAPFNGRILRATSQTRSGTGTDTVTFTIMVAGVDLTDYQDLVSTASNGVETTTGNDDADNDFDIGDPLEVDITSLGGTGHNYFDVEIQGELR